MDREAWLAERRKGLGATDIARIVTGAYGGAYQVWLEKTQGVEAAESEPMRIGKLLEPAMMQEAARRWDNVVPGERVTMGIIAANLDASIVVGVTGSDDWEKQPLDFKTSGEAHDWGEDGSADVPEYVWVQLQTQMLACGADRGYVLLLLAARGFEFRQYEIPCDPEFCATIETIAADWWQKHIVEGIEPDAEDDDYANASTLLARRAPKAGAIVEWKREDKKLVNHWINAKKGIAALTAMEEAAKGRILAKMGDAETVELPGGLTLTRKLIKRKGYKVEPGEYWQLREKGIANDD